MTTTTSATIRISPRNLQAVRQLRGLSQNQLSRRSGVAQGHISELERGNKQARPATIHKLARTLDVPVPMLLDNYPDGIEEILQRMSTHAADTASTLTEALTP